MTDFNSDNRKKHSILFLVVLIIISGTLMEIYMNKTWNDGKQYKKPELYWKSVRSTGPPFSLRFANGTDNETPKFVVSNGINTILICDIITKSISNTISIKNSTRLTILDLNKIRIGNNSNLKIIAHSALNDTIDVIYMIDAVDGALVWNFSFNYDAGISRLVYYDKNSRNLIFEGIEDLFCINLDSKDIVWKFHAAGDIISSTVLSANSTKGGYYWNNLSKDRLIALWSITQYGQGIGSNTTYTLYCINLLNGSLRWMSNFQYPVSGSVADIVAGNLIEKSPKRDLNNDGTEDLTITSANTIYVVSGDNGAIIYSITYPNIEDAIVVEDFRDNGAIEIVAESKNGLLTAFSLPKGHKLWEIKLDKIARLDLALESQYGPKNILLISNETYTLIRSNTGSVIFNKSLLNEISGYGESISEKISFSWTHPCFEDLNNDSKNEIILGVYASEYQPHYQIEQKEPRYSRVDAIYSKSEANKEAIYFCMVLVLDSNTGNIIEYLNLSTYGFTYLAVESYAITFHGDLFIFLLAWSAQSIEEKYIVIIKFE